MRTLLHLLICISALFAGTVTNAQKTYSFRDFPVDFDYPEEWRIEQDSRNSWVVTDGTTEFNILLFRANKRFNADSLRYMAMELYADPSIQNLQVSEVGGGTMGNIPAEKCVLSFMHQGKLYLSIMYLAKFHINHQYNSILFYFEIGEGNAKSYEPLQEHMISSLRYRDFQYRSFSQHDVTVEFPSHWAGVRPAEDDSLLIKFTDGRGSFSVFLNECRDSLPVFDKLNAYRQYLRKNPGDRKDLKVNLEKDKWNNLPVQWFEMRYQINEMGVLYRIVQKNWHIVRKVEGECRHYQILFEYPEGYESFYLPVEKKVMQALKLPGAAE